ncbi:DUF4124 domain-containing protein [Polynucleobacter sp. AP-Kolm-20A-A1]|uniref:DUF4124 domain-containing protein n=1 Tax=Polynucleobacter sp. AP-Kolm-20A-A1 TaxID=2081041 RepID=UPI001BFEBD1E|nr:DUF4124 domain-containing protein [Polynucleobacter sp. AP-Kolm-20A-A1]QWE21450.1 DUF4124 domain-containing protein [Polynucleobacter sp. AP-Kolm-20A-A1]
MFLKNGLITVFTLGLASLAQADVYRCSTDNGSVTLSNVEKGSNCKKMALPPPEPKKSGSSKAAASDVASAPKDVKAVDKPKSTYDSAAMERKRIIQEEMDLEKVRLSAVQARIKELSAAPNKSPDQLKDLVSLQQKENLHASNLQILQKELNK